ncbi:hypothetical protein ACX80Z_13795 [Arthrobacter sp. TMT4-20]
MKVRIIEDETGRFGVEGETGEYDSFLPVQTLWIDRAPIVISPDRLAIAAALLFQNGASGELVFESEIAPATGKAIQDFLAPASVAINPVNLSPMALPQGSNRFIVTTPEFTNHYSTSRKLASNITLDIRRSDQWAGSVRSMSNLMVASNAWIFSEANQVDVMCVYLAVAILFAEELDIDEVVLPGPKQIIFTSDRISRLVGATRLGVLIEGEGKFFP